ncbi:hypothetical protein LZ30DRAFT_777339 [Colletotrichum cereale]|nr:hypothetical protein LZ30DRAFT_777339 [Colletotrichum cereale]
MPSNKSNRPAVRCHPMSTRCTSSWQGGSSSLASGSSESSVLDSSPDDSPARASGMTNTSRKRRHSASESEDPEASRSIRRPMKKLRVSERHSATDIDSDHDSDMPTSPSEPEDELEDELDDLEDELGDDEAASESPLPTLHVRSDGFWPTIRNHYLNSLEDESIRIDIPCIICGDECVVAGQLHWGMRRPEGVGRELPVILCCGHIIGDECLEKWWQARQLEGEPPNCPICRMSLQCSDCSDCMPGWPLSQDIPVGETRTLQQGGHRVTRCNGCEAEDMFGDAMLLGDRDDGVTYADEPRLLQGWFDVMRDRAAAEVRAGMHGNVASGDVADLILYGTFWAMRQRLDDFEDEVRGCVRDTVALTEGDLNRCLPWNHAASLEQDENDFDDWWAAPLSSGTYNPY